MALANFERAWCSLCRRVGTMSWEHEGLCIRCVAQLEALVDDKEEQAYGDVTADAQ